jgi:hypothetical protein
LSILNDDYVPFLPTTTAVNDADQRNNYLQCVSAYDLLSLIGKHPKFSDSKSITGIVKDVDTDSREIFNVLGDLSKIPVSRKIMSNFMINCAKLKENQLLLQLREYIMECEDFLSLKYVSWYKVALGLITLDDEFESKILEEIKHRRIFIDTDTFKYGLEILVRDKSVKNMFKQRIIECGYKPQGFFDKLTGSISWDSYAECFKCSGNKCVVYLDDNYKSFLNKHHKIRSVDKIKILIYIELRLRLLSKYIALEGMRIVKKKQSRVTSLLHKIYKDDVNRGKLHKNDLRQFVMKPFLGGAPVSDETDKPKPPLEDPPPPLEDPPPPATEEPPPPATDEPPPLAGATESIGDTVVNALKNIGGIDEPLPEPTVTPIEPTVTPIEPTVTPIEPTVTPIEPTVTPIEPNVTPEPDDTPIEPTVIATDDTPIEPTVIATDDTPIEPNVTPDPTVVATDDTTATPNALTQPPIKPSNIIYIAYNDTKSNNFNIDDTDELHRRRSLIAKELKGEMSKVTGVTDSDTLTVYRVRFGPTTTSVEVGIHVTGAETLSEEDIKRNLVQSIVNDTIKSDLFVTSLELVKDIYFDGISKFPELAAATSQYKRVLVELPGAYPTTEHTRVHFEEQIISSIKDILEEPDLTIERIHIERISKVPESNDRVVVQFLIMNGVSEAKTPNEIIMNFRQKYDTGNTDYANKYQLSNVVFGDPSIVLDGSDIDTSHTLLEERERVEGVDESTLRNLEGNYHRLAYYGCDLTMDDLKNNIITAQTPLFTQCEPNIHQYLTGFIRTKT